MAAAACRRPDHRLAAAAQTQAHPGAGLADLARLVGLVEALAGVHDQEAHQGVVPAARPAAAALVVHPLAVGVLRGEVGVLRGEADARRAVHQAGHRVAEGGRPVVAPVVLRAAAVLLVVVLWDQVAVHRAEVEHLQVALHQVAALHPQVAVHQAEVLPLQVVLHQAVALPPQVVLPLLVAVHQAVALLRVDHQPVVEPRAVRQAVASRLEDRRVVAVPRAAHAQQPVPVPPWPPVHPRRSCLQHPRRPPRPQLVRARCSWLPRPHPLPQRHPPRRASAQCAGRACPASVQFAAASSSRQPRPRQQPRPLLRTPARRPLCTPRRPRRCTPWRPG